MKTRGVAAAAVFISAVVHASLWFDGYRDVAVIGPAFMLNAVGGVVIAILLLRWRSWVPLLLAVGFGAATLGAFAFSVTVGLFGELRWAVPMGRCGVGGRGNRGRCRRRP